MQDPLSHISNFQYDLGSRLVQAADPKNQTVQYTYTANDQIRQQTDAAGGITQLYI